MSYVAFFYDLNKKSDRRVMKVKKEEKLEEIVLNALIKIREDKTRRRELKAKVSKIENELENKTLNSQKKQDLNKELDEINYVIKKTEIKRFEEFLKLIVYIRNIDSIKNGYKKKDFLSEVKTNLKNTEKEF